MPGRKMVITIDAETGKVDKVTDENGVPATSGNINEVKLGDRNLSLVPDHTFIHTHSSPGCCWYFIGGTWYYICS